MFLCEENIPRTSSKWKFCSSHSAGTNYFKKLSLNLNCTNLGILCSLILVYIIQRKHLAVVLYYILYYDSGRFIEISQYMCHKSLQESKLIFFNPLPHHPDFQRPWKSKLLKTSWEKEKILVTSILSFTHNALYPIRERNNNFSNFIFCRRQNALKLGQSIGFLFGKELRYPSIITLGSWSFSWLFSLQCRCKHSLNLDTQSKSLNACICIKIFKYPAERLWSWLKW